MSNEPNLKQRIKNGLLTIGVQVPWNATKTQIEDIWSRDDEYNYISVDSQHNPLHEPQLQSLCVSAQELSIPVHFRIKHTHYTFQIGNWLDLGPSIIEVPQTETEHTAQEAVDYFYYSPFGKRSAGGQTRVGISEQSDDDNYLPWWNDYGVLMLQVESVQAIVNIPKLHREGVDCISWGPADLAIDRSKHPHHPIAESDDAAVDYASKVCKDSGVKLMIRNYDWKLRQKYIDMGVSVLLERPK